MLQRKISSYIRQHLQAGSDKILLVEGARQVGKSYIIREVGKQVFTYFHEINFVEDSEGRQLFKDCHNTEDFYVRLSVVAGTQLGNKRNTLIFLDEIQQYPQFLTMLKFLREDNRFSYIASGSLLGITLQHITSIPVGSIIRKEMYQLDFEEFLMAVGWGEEAIAHIKECYIREVGLPENMHNNLMKEFQRYLLVGGMPDAVNEYIATHNIVNVREIQMAIRRLYKDDAAKYEQDNAGKLMVRRIYDMVPSQMENKKKRIVAKDIRGKDGDRFDRYQADFEYLISSGITLSVHAVSNPKYPLAESTQKNLLKLYLNDVGMLTAQLYQTNILPILNNEASVNLGAVYESVVAQELKAHGHRLFYYDNRSKGEVDFLVDDHQHTAVLPIEVKSGKDYTVHCALNNLLTTADYHILRAVVLYNGREVQTIRGVLYLPIYYVMFLGQNHNEREYIF